MNHPLVPRGPLKPGPISTYEEEIRRHLFLREVGRLLIVELLGERRIAQRLGIARSTVRRMLGEVRALLEPAPFHLFLSPFPVSTREDIDPEPNAMITTVTADDALFARTPGRS